MFEIETKKLKISDELNRKIDMICRFAYVKPHILKVKGNDYLILEEYAQLIIGLSIYYKKELKKCSKKHLFNGF